MSRGVFGGPKPAEQLRVMTRGGRFGLMKAEPDQRDHEIFTMLNAGKTIREIALHYGFADASIEKRIHWCKAKRWATFDGKLLDAGQRLSLIEVERKIFRKVVA
jgi:hypothetical protein